MNNRITDEETLRRFRQAQQAEDTRASNMVVDEETVRKFRQAQGVKEEPAFEPEDIEVPEGSTIGDVLRTGRTLIQGIGAEAGAGLYGLATFVGTGDFRRSVEAIESAKEYLSYVPETPGAQENLRVIGEIIAPLGEAVETVSDNAADITFEYTGSPNLAGVAAAIPLAALEIAGLKGAGAGIKQTKRLTEMDVRKAQKKMLKDPELKYSGAVAEVKLDKGGALVEDRIGQKLVSNGLPENQVAVVTNSSKPTKNLMKDMVKQFEASKGNDVAAMANKTTDVIGKSLQNRLVALKSQRAGLGKRLDFLVKGDVGKQPIDIGPALGGINSMLAKEGVKPVMRNGQLSLPKNQFLALIYV